jgi:enoyl-CoA hydratase/carnithine racemase
VPDPGPSNLGTEPQARPVPRSRLVGELDTLFEDRASVLLVDLDQAGANTIRPLPVAFAGVVVGVSRQGPAHATATAADWLSWPAPDVLAGVDIILVPTGVVPVGPTPGASWVAVDDVDAEVRRVIEAAGRSPIAAVLLMQVLRAGVFGSLEHDLAVESLAYSTLQAAPEFHRWLNARPTAGGHRPQVGPPVILERMGDALTITLNRPQVRNAYNVELRDGLDEAFDLVALVPEIRTVTLRGAGPAFSSGGDLDEFGSSPGPAASHLIRTSRSPALGLFGVADRVTAELHGACVGAGIEIPALAGRVVATPDTRMLLPEMSMGLIPGAGGTASLPRRIGRHRTAWFALSGAWLNAATGHDWGLIDAVREDPDLP